MTWSVWCLTDQHGSTVVCGCVRTMVYVNILPPWGRQTGGTVCCSDGIVSACCVKTQSISFVLEICYRRKSTWPIGHIGNRVCSQPLLEHCKICLTCSEHESFTIPSVLHDFPCTDTTSYNSSYIAQNIESNEAIVILSVTSVKMWNTVMSLGSGKEKREGHRNTHDALYLRCRSQCRSFIANHTAVVSQGRLVPR